MAIKAGSNDSIKHYCWTPVSNNIFCLQAEINNFRECFERGEDPLDDMTDGNDINSVAGVLKLYLRELREPIFSVQYFDQFMELASEYSWKLSLMFMLLSMIECILPSLRSILSSICQCFKWAEK